jgi:hypothetical protein
MNGPASRVASFNQQVFSQTTATTAAKAGWRFTGYMHPTRYGHTATRLENGKVLVAGGAGANGRGGEDGYNEGDFVIVSSELYDPIQGMWSFTGELRHGRLWHTATLLKDGRVLIAGGADYGRLGYLNNAELYDPATGEWRPTASFNTIEFINSATLLANGKVLAVGWSKPQGPSAELYDPVTETWSITAAPSVLGIAVLLPDGKVLAVSNENEIYDPATERWSSAGHLNVIRGASTLTLLTNGKVLATGGTDESGLLGSELYDPSTGAWSVTGPPFAGLGTATLLPDGRVLMSGGYTSQNPASGEEIYDPDTGQWSLTDRLKAPRFAHTATLLVDGRVLVTGGFDGDIGIGGIYRASCELYGLIPIIRITSVSVSGKKLFLSGENFLVGAVILLNGEEEKTRNDDQNASTMLIGKKAGKKIKAGDKLQVRNPDGTLSEEFIFTGS